MVKGCRRFLREEAGVVIILVHSLEYFEYIEVQPVLKFLLKVSSNRHFEWLSLDRTEFFNA